MSAERHLVFWQQVPSIHQAPFLRALAETTGVRVTLVTEAGIPAWRRASGWKEPDFGRVERVMYGNCARLLDTSDALHVFSGTRGPLQHFLVQAVRRRRRIALFGETRVWSWPLGPARQVASTVEALLLRERVELVLAIGSLGVSWYEKAGYPRSRIAPFAYVVDRPASVLVEADGVPRVCFVGRLVRGKGIDILLKALSRVEAPWSLTIVGEGHERAFLERLAQGLGIAARVSFLGARSNEDATTKIGQSDLLVLPSRSKDGWGAVVNEALMQGVPVICTDSCGAKDLVDGDMRGEVVDSGSVSSLTKAIERRILRGPMSEDTRDAIRRWSECISGPSLSAYLLRVLEARSVNEPLPAPPWAAA